MEREAMPHFLGRLNAEVVEAELQRARTEQASAEREAARLARIAQNARNEAD